MFYIFNSKWCFIYVLHERWNNKSIIQHVPLSVVKLSVFINWSLVNKGHFTRAIFEATFVAPQFQWNFCRAQVTSLHRACKLAAISPRFLCYLSPLYGTYFEHVRNLMQLDATWQRFGGNCSKNRTLNRSKIAASLHLRQKLHWRARQKSHKKSHV